MMKTPSFILDGNNAIRALLPLLSLGKDTARLKSLAKMSTHAYKNSEKTQIIFIDNLIINPQFIGSRQTHNKRVLH